MRDALQHIALVNETVAAANELRWKAFGKMELRTSPSLDGHEELSWSTEPVNGVQNEAV